MGENLSAEFSAAKNGKGRKMPNQITPNIYREQNDDGAGSAEKRGKRVYRNATQLPENENNMVFIGAAGKAKAKNEWLNVRWQNENGRDNQTIYKFIYNMNL